MAISVSTALCLLLVVTLGSAAPVQEKKSFSSRCCWPKVFESKIGISIGQVSAVGSDTFLVDGTIHGDWDTRMKIAVIEHVYNGAGGLDITIIEDLKAKVIYIIQVAQQNCTKVPLPDFLGQVPCMSKLMTKTGTQKLGLGTESLDVDVYEVNTTDIIVKTYVTPTQCLPVVQTFLGPIFGAKQAQGQVYSDLSLSIRDPSVFTIPDYCHQNAEPMVAVVNPVVKDAVSRHRARRSLWA